MAKGGSPPDIGQLEFHQFCQDAGIFDSHFTPRVLDIAFAAVNFEEEEQDGNDDRALIRFEFSEILVRIVKTKYLDTKKCDSYSEGLEKVIKDHIFPMCDMYYSWSAFRKEHLWDFDVN